MRRFDKIFFCVKYILILLLISYMGIVLFMDFDVESRRVMMEAERNGEISLDFVKGVKALSNSQTPVKIKAFFLSCVLVVVSLLRPIYKSKKNG